MTDPRLHRWKVEGLQSSGGSYSPYFPHQYKALNAATSPGLSPVRKGVGQHFPFICECVYRSPREFQDNFRESKKTLRIWKKRGRLGLLPIFNMESKWECDNNERMRIIASFLLQMVKRKERKILNLSSVQGKERRSRNWKSGRLSFIKVSPP